MGVEAGSGGFFEFKRRVVFSLLRSASRVALKLRLPLNDLVGLAQMAYFEQAKRYEGLSRKEIADIFGKGLWTVSKLHGRYRGDFFAPEREIELRFELFRLISEKPKTIEELTESFPGRALIEIEEAVEDLLREKRVIRHGNRIRRNPEHQAFYSDSDIALRIAGLNRMMDVVAGVTTVRLLEEDNDSAMARSLVINARSAEVQRILVEHWDQLRKSLLTLEDQELDNDVETRQAVTLAGCPIEGTEK